MKLIQRIFALGIAAALTIPSTSFATNGMFLIGFGAKSRSMGGVGIGLTQDAIGGAMNPAGITALKIDGMRMDLGAMLLYTPRASTIPDNRPGPTAGNPVNYKSGSNLFLIPSMGAIYKFNRKVSMGFSFVGAGGGNTRYTKLAPNGFNFLNPAGRTDVGETLGVQLLQAQMAMTLAYKVNKKNTIAVSPIIGIQVFRAYGLGVFKPFSADQARLSNNGNDWAYGGGIRFGWQGKVHERLTLGATYASKIYFTDFDKYAGLFAEQGNLDSPANFGLGLAFDVTDDVVLALDWVRVMYSDVAAINNPIEQLNSANPALESPASGFLGNDAGAGFGWEDQDIYKLGVRYRHNSKWDLMMGYNYGEGQIPNDQLLFSTLAPAVVKHHLTMGATYRPKPGMEWTLAYVHAFHNKESGKTQSGSFGGTKGPFDDFYPDSPAFTGPGDVDLEMRQDSLELSFTFNL